MSFWSERTGVEKFGIVFGGLLGLGGGVVAVYEATKSSPQPIVKATNCPSGQRYDGTKCVPIVVAHQILLTADGAPVFYAPSTTPVTIEFAFPSGARGLLARPTLVSGNATVNSDSTVTIHDGSSSVLSVDWTSDDGTTEIITAINVNSGTTACPQGTTYNPQTGACDPDVGGIGGGSVTSITLAAPPAAGQYVSLPTDGAFSIALTDGIAASVIGSVSLDANVNDNGDGTYSWISSGGPGQMTIVWTYWPSIVGQQVTTTLTFGP